MITTNRRLCYGSKCSQPVSESQLDVLARVVLVRTSLPRPGMPPHRQGRPRAKRSSRMRSRRYRWSARSTGHPAPHHPISRLRRIQDSDSNALGDVFFDYDRFQIRKDAMPVLDANAGWLRANGSKTVLIEGHCDERGTVAYNLVLGEKRARAVKKYLQDMGVAGLAASDYELWRNQTLLQAAERRLLSTESACTLRDQINSRRVTGDLSSCVRHEGGICEALSHPHRRNRASRDHLSDWLCRQGRAD